MSAGIPLNTIGLIVEGDEAGRFVEVVDDNERTGGYLIFTYADRERSAEVFDSWVESFDAVRKYFVESVWLIDWPPSPS